MTNLFTFLSDWKLKYICALVVLLCVGVGNAWANDTDEFTYTSFFTACTSSGSNTSGSYTSFTNKSGSSSDAVYAGMFYKHGNGPDNCHDYIQMRSNSSNSGLVSTTSGGKVVSVTVTWNSKSSNGATLNVYGSNSAYSAATDLYDNDTDGDLIGTIVKGTSVSLDIDDDYEYIGLRSNSGALYLDDISIEWSNKTLSSIVKKTDATKTTYIEGEKFNPAGLVITATYDDASTEDIAYTGNETKFSFSPSTATALTTSNDKVTITYGGQSTDATHSQGITVFSITLQAKDEDGNAIAGGGPGAPTFTAATRTITAAANAANYVFKEWVVTNASATSTSTTPTTITSAAPSGNITVTAKYYKPINVYWKVKGAAWTPAQLGTSTVGYNTAWSTLTLPTDPTTSDGCGDKFMGWTPGTIATPLDKDDDADAISDLNLLNSGNKSGKTTKITTETTFHAVFADYTK